MAEGIGMGIKPLGGEDRIGGRTRYTEEVDSLRFCETVVCMVWGPDISVGELSVEVGGRAKVAGSDYWETGKIGSCDMQNSKLHNNEENLLI